MKRLTFTACTLALLVAIIYLVNYFSISKPVSDALAKDDRDKGIEISAHYKYYTSPQTLVFNVQAVTGLVPADIFRCFLQSAEALKDHNFSKVELSYRGKTKFYVTGEYFKTLGQEYSTQNVIYTIDHFPENIYTVDGVHAYEPVEGGFLGVMSQQMTNFSDAINKWLDVNN